jgi:hypothetical protein
MNASRGQEPDLPDLDDEDYEEYVGVPTFMSEVTCERWVLLGELKRQCDRLRDDLVMWREMN